MDAQRVADEAHHHLDPRTPRKKLRRELRRMFEAGRKEHGGLSLDYDAFATGALAAIQARPGPSGVVADPRDLAHALRTAAAADLYLARCCEEDLEGAWERLHEIYLPRLRGLARRRGADALEAETLADEVLADLACPPPRSKARTVLGTFAGRGSLVGWLSVILVRRMASNARQRRPRTNDLRLGSDRTGTGRPGSSEEVDPAAAAEVGETATRLQGALRKAWGQCSERERLTLILKYRDGLRQRAVAAILGVGEPRVSRLVRQALTKLKDAAALCGVSAGDSGRPVLTRALEDALASLGEEIPPSPWTEP